MEYKGKLYGKIGEKYFDTSKTSEDWDDLEKKAKQWDELEKKISAQYGHTDELGEWVENENEGDGLITIGEIAATAFGFL